MNRGAAEEPGDEFSLPRAPVTFMERAAAAAADEGFCEGVASGEDIKLLLSKAEQGDQGAQFDLGLEYYLKNNFEEAASWLKKAVEQGYADAQLLLGATYQIGKGVPQDRLKAVAYYKLAAEQGYADAQLLLGRMYYRSEDVSQNLEEAAKWYRKGADRGDVKAIGALESLKVRAAAPHAP
ncbi:MAG: tetratricopeptide repeat protein [Holosporales bacterium]